MFCKNIKFNKGFTLIELMVVMTIAIILMTTVVVKQQKWNDQLTVNTQAYEMALMFRQAQLYSLGVRENPSSSGDKFSVGYGVYFHKDNTGSGNVNNYIFFADKNKNLTYDVGIDSLIETQTFKRGVIIKDVCGDDRCFNSGGGPLAQASISFFRPELKANISLLNNGGNSVDSPPVIISLKSVGNQESFVKIEANGQISIDQ